MEAVNGGSLGEDKGGPPPPSPLTGCYLLVVIGEPHSEVHKDIILQKVAKGLLSWNVNECLVDLEKELTIITEQGLEGEEARYGERLIQFASENLVTEILIHPAVSTLSQCVRNLLSSFTRHRHIIHAGYTFQGNGSWALQDGTFSYSDFAEAFQEIEVQRVIHAYENGISIDLHCTPEGDWTRLPKEYFTKSCKVRVNSTDVLTTGSPSISSFTKYLEPFLIPTALEDILESSDVVGNIRFSRPTLYVFPGGQGDAALFGINGFNMLLDGGYSRKACFWDFVRHLDRLDAVLMTRLNNSSVSGVSSVLKRKKQGAVYPQIGHFFCNIQERKSLLSPDGDKDKDPLIISLIEEGQNIIQDLRHLNLCPQSCYRESDPIILYHKVGHGTLNMYVLSPDKNSREVRDFLQKWNQWDSKLFTGAKFGKEFSFPLQNLVSICALLVWQPANPNDTITRILYPGSTPQKKIFEGLDRLKNLEYMKHPMCLVKSIVPTKKSKQDVIEKITAKETKGQVINEKKIENKALIDESMKNGEINGDVINKEKHVKKSDSQESDKEKKTKKIEDVKKAEESKKTENIGKVMENGEKVKPKQKPAESKIKAKGESQQKKKIAPIEKRGPPTPKKSMESTVNGDVKEKEKRVAHKPSPTATPAKSTKDANNRKVIENKKAPLKKETVPKQVPPATEAKTKTERKPISRRPKTAKGPPSPMKKMTNGVQKPDSLSKRGKLDKEGTTDSSTVSTPSADQESILKKDISKLTPEEIQQLKEKELEELKEEQDAIKEIEAVFRKGEVQGEESEPGVRKIKEMSIDDNLDTEEYLIIEKEEIEHDSLDQETKEDEMQKLVRDSEESEKQRKLSAEEEELKDKLQEKKPVQTEETGVQEPVAAKISEVLDSKKPVTSPEDKGTSATDKKEIVEEEVKEVIESHPEEKVSANIESGATTTAPTLPEDERITLDEIKEDNGQVIEEKHVKEETKEKEVPIIQLPPKSQQDSQSKQPPVVGIPLDKQKHVRDIVKTPDEVADLPVHEEADYHEFHGDEKKCNEVEAQKQDKEDKKEVEKVEEKEMVSPKKEEDIIGKSGKDIVQKTEIDKHIDQEQDVKEVEKESKQAEAAAMITAQPTSEKQEKQGESDTEPNYHVIKTVSTGTTEETEKSDILEKAEVETKEKSDQDKNLFLQEEKLKESIVDEWVVITKEEEKILEVAQEAGQILIKKQTDLKSEKITDTERELVETENLQHALKDKVVSDFIAKEVEQELSQVKEEEKTLLKDTQSKISEEVKKGKDIDTDDEPIHDIRKEDEIEEILEKDKEDIKALIEEADKRTVSDKIIDKKPEQKDGKAIEDTKELPKIIDDKVSVIKETKEDIAAIDHKLQELKREVTIPVDELQFDKIEKDLTKIDEPPQIDMKQELEEITKIDDKLNELKTLSDIPTSEKDEIKVEKSTRSPEHAESVILSDSSPEENGSRILKELDIDKSELGRKSPAEREEDVKKIVASVAEVLKSEAPLEEFQGKLTFTQELRETHITTQDSPILEAKVIKTDDIPPIPEEPLEEEIKQVKIDKSDTLPDTKEIMEPSSKDDAAPEDDLDKVDKEDEASTVHRMLVTASSEDGGEEIEICPAGTITFSRSSESSGRSSPEPSQKTQSQKSSIVETLSETLSTVKQLTEKSTKGEVQDLETQVEKKIDLPQQSSPQLEKDLAHDDQVDIAVKVDEKLISEKAKAGDGDKKTDSMKTKEIAEDRHDDIAKKHVDDDTSLKTELEMIEPIVPDIAKQVVGLKDDRSQNIGEEISKEDSKISGGRESPKAVDESKDFVDDKIKTSKSDTTPELTKDEQQKATDKIDELSKQEDLKSLEAETDKAPSIVADTKLPKEVDVHEERYVKEELHTKPSQLDHITKDVVVPKDTSAAVSTDLDKLSQPSKETIHDDSSKIEDKIKTIEVITKSEVKETKDVCDIKEDVKGDVDIDEKIPSEIISLQTIAKIDAKPELKPVDVKISDAVKISSEECGDAALSLLQRKDSIIEKAQEFIEKSEEALEDVLTSIGSKVHSVLDDIIKTDSESKLQDELTDVSSTITKSAPESGESKSSKDNVEEGKDQKQPKEADTKDTENKLNEDKNNVEDAYSERRSSIIEAAEEFIEKSEKKLGSVFSTIGETAKSVLNDILPEDKSKSAEISPPKTDDLDEIHKDEHLVEMKSEKNQDKDYHPVDEVKKEIPSELKQLDTKESGIKADEVEKDVDEKTVGERRGSIIEAAEEFIEKSEKALESVFSSIGGTAKSVLHDLLPEEKVKIDEPSAEKVNLGKIEKDQATHEEKSVEETDITKQYDKELIIKDKEKAKNGAEKVPECPEPKELDTKESVGDKNEHIKHDTLERRGSIIDVAEEFIEKSEKTLESVFSAIGGAASSVIHDILTEDKTKTSESSTGKIEDLSATKKDELTHQKIEIPLETISTQQDTSGKDKPKEQIAESSEPKQIDSKETKALSEDKLTEIKQIEITFDKDKPKEDVIGSSELKQTDAKDTKTPPEEDKSTEIKATDKVTVTKEKPKEDILGGLESKQADSKDLVEEDKKESPERRSSIIEITEQFIEKSEKMLESVFSATGEAAKSVLHSILPEDEMKTSEHSPSKTDNLHKAKHEDEDIQKIEKTKDLQKEESKITTNIVLNEVNIDKDTLEKNEKDMDTKGVELDDLKKDQVVIEKEKKQDEFKESPQSKSKEVTFVKDQQDQLMGEDKVDKDTTESEKKQIETIEKEIDVQISHVSEKITDTSHLGQSISFEKCHPTDDPKLDIKETKEQDKASAAELPKLTTDKFSVEKEIIQQEEKQIKEEFDQLKQGYDDLSKLTETVSFEKQHLFDDLKSDEKKAAEQDKKSTIDISKSQPEEFKVDKETIGQAKKQIEEVGSSEDLPKVTESITFEKCQPSNDSKSDKKEAKGQDKGSQDIAKPEPDDFKVEKQTIEKEEKQIDGKVDQLQRDSEDLSKITESVSFEKCHLSDDSKSDKKEAEEHDKKTIEDLSKSGPKEFKVDKETIHKEENQIDEQVIQLKQTYEDLSKITKSVSFEKCHPSDDFKYDKKEAKEHDKKTAEDLSKSEPEEFKVDKETLRKEEKQIDEEVDQLKRSYEDLTKITESVSFEKCHPSDEYKVEKETIQKEEKQIDEEVDQLKRSYEDLTKITESVSFEKCHPSDEYKVEKETIQKEEKQIDEEVNELRRSYEDLSKLTESVSFKKCHPSDEYKVDKETIQKEEKQIDEKFDQLRRSYEDLSKLTESVSFEKCHPSDEYKVDKETLQKEEKQIDEEVDQLKRSYEDLSKLTESVSFEKCHPSDEYKVGKETIEKEEKQIDEQVGKLKQSYEDLSKITESVSFEKCHPSAEYKVDKESILKEEKKVESQIKQTSEKIQEPASLAKSTTFDKCDLSDAHKAERTVCEALTSHSSEFKVDKDATEKEKKQVDEKLDEFKVDKVQIQKDEKEIDDQIMHVSETVEKLSDLAKSVSFEKCHQLDELKVDKQIMEKEEKQIEQEVSHFKESCGDLSELNKSISLEKCKPVNEFLDKDEKHIEKSDKDVSKLTGAHSFEKCKITDEFKVGKDILERGEKQIDDVSDELRKSYEDLSKLTDSVLLAETQPAHIFETEKSILDSNKVEHLSKDERKAGTSDSTKTEAVEEQSVSSQTEKCEKESMEKTSFEKDTSLKIAQTEHKKISISDVEISIKTDVDHKGASKSFLDNERSIIYDSTDAKIYKPPTGDSISQDGSSIVTIQASAETDVSSDKSSPDMELSGKTTPPTVPISPIAKDIRSPSSKQDSGLSEQTETDDEDLSTKSQVAHSQSDLDELDMKMDPMSMSFYGALPQEQLQEGEPVPSTYLYEITKAKYTKDIKIEGEEGGLKEVEMSLMTASFIGELPSTSTEIKPDVSKQDDSKKDAVDSWGKPLGLPAPTYLYEVTKARFSSQSGEIDDIMTSSFIGELPTSSQTQEKPQDPMTTSVYFGDSSDSSYDPIASWGKPLGLPSPAPPNNNEKGTPKKEKKLPAYVSAKNKLNDDKKRAESPSKLKTRKVNPVYVDLTYVPHHGNHYYSYVDFFRRVRARYYVFSGLEPSRQVYDALLEAKQTWEDKELEVTIIPTYDTDILGYWVAENEELLSKFKVDLAPSASRCTINLQDHETSCSAYRLEF